MVSGVTSVIPNGVKYVHRLILRWRDVIPQLRVTLCLIIFVIHWFLPSTGIKLLPVKRQMGTFKSLIVCGNLLLRMAFVGRSIQLFNDFMSKFTLAARSCEKIRCSKKKLLTTWVENPSVPPKRRIVWT
jgi:hypothetical protein